MGRAFWWLVSSEYPFRIETVSVQSGSCCTPFHRLDIDLTTVHRILGLIGLEELTSVDGKHSRKEALRQLSNLLLVF